MIKRFLKYHPVHKKFVPNLDIVFLLRPTFFFSVWVMVVIGMSSAQMHLVDYPLWITEFSFMTFFVFLGLTFVCSSTFILNQVSDDEIDTFNKQLFIAGKYINPEKLEPLGRLGGPNYCRTQDIFQMERAYPPPDKVHPNEQPK